MLCSERWFSRERSSRIELLQNKFFQSVSRVRFVDVERLKSLENWEVAWAFALLFSWNFAYSSIWDQEIKFTEISCELAILYILEKLRISIASAHSEKRRRNFLLLRLHILREDELWRIDLDVSSEIYSCRRISETENRDTQYFYRVLTSLSANTLLHAKSVAYDIHIIFIIQIVSLRRTISDQRIDWCLLKSDRTERHDEVVFDVCTTYLIARLQIR